VRALVDPGQLCLQRRDVAMRIARKARAGGKSRVEQRCVIEPVLEHVITASHQHGCHGQVRHVAGRKQQGTRTRNELRQFLFQRVVFGVVAAHKVRRAAAYPPSARSRAECRDDAWMIGETEVVVAAERDTLAPCDRDTHATRFTGINRASVA
jgi:hypothetical protein